MNSTFVPALKYTCLGIVVTGCRTLLWTLGSYKCFLLVTVSYPENIPTDSHEAIGQVHRLEGIRCSFAEWLSAGGGQVTWGRSRD